jgi:hypothetical protein
MFVKGNAVSIKVATAAIDSGEVTLSDELITAVAKTAGKKFNPTTVSEILALSTAKCLVGEEYALERTDVSLITKSQRELWQIFSGMDDKPEVHLISLITDVLGVRRKDALELYEKGCFPFVMYRKVSEFKKLSERRDGRQQGDILPIYNLWRLFGVAAQIDHFLAKTDKNLHDAGQFRLPKSDKWNVNEWASLVARIPSTIAYVSIADKLEEVCGGVPTTKDELLDLVDKLPKDGNLFAIEMMSSGIVLSDDEAADYVEAINGGSKTINNITSIELTDGEYTLSQMEYNDPQQMAAGLHTDCCQHLHGAASTCAMDAYKSEDSCIYVVRKSGTIVAQSYAWLNAKRTKLVFDSIETLSKANKEVIANLFANAAIEIKTQMCLKGVYAGGVGYGVLSNLSKDKEVLNTPKHHSSSVKYTDANTVIQLA